ncbi:hypothetical protein [Novosphingobium colocasiae]|uniref:Lipoprotein n=1 Tax=Novosphingobium colocasiae TaxID=1256513 RepID=A0A918PEL3_9SPHN|nr:hypothetical protein [Novosphingobium colocasiae]GGZ02348.1 hypothetical protein GCM10011614_16760 [Novosphingobium colocasiae]
MARRIGQAGWRRLVAALGIGALTLLLAACLFAPGKFTSSLDIGKDRSFTFRYSGEIYMLPLIEAEKKARFTPEACHADDTFDERPCHQDELAEQQKAWEAQQAAKRKSDAQAAQYLFGGIDPGNPAAAQEIAARLQRQAGWNKVTYLGAGRFAVDYVLSGRLDHDFTFPTVERFPMANAFVQIALRDDGSVRIDAPGFGPAGGGSGAAGLMGGLGGMTAGDDGGKPNPIDGTFIIRTDGQILANNTDEGPVAETTGKALAWTINPRTQVAPMALVQLSPR